jgi:hypothetical protein
MILVRQGGIQLARGIAVLVLGIQVAVEDIRQVGAVVLGLAQDIRRGGMVDIRQVGHQIMKAVDESDKINKKKYIFGLCQRA